MKMSANSTTRFRIVAGTLLGAACLSLLPAHDFWIEPSLFTNPVQRPVSFELRVGDQFKGSVFTRQSSHIQSFRVTGPSGTSLPVPGLDGKSPAGYFRFQEPGLYIVSYRSNDNFVSLGLPKFRSYLHEEGLERILPLLPEEDSGEPVRETFSRCAKSLVLVTGETETADLPGTDTRVGLPLELVAGAAPHHLAGGGEFPLTLFFQNEPLSGSLVVAMQKTTGARQQLRSDEQGKAQFSLSPGVWLVKAVHMVPADKLDAQWQSYWASLTLEIPSAE